MSAARTETPSASAGTPVVDPSSLVAARRARAGGLLGRLGPATVPGVLMLVVGLAGANRPVLSWDEVATADVAQRSVGRIWHLMYTIDAVFAPYYLLMHAWTSMIGRTVLDLRLPSIAAMAGAVAVTGELGRRLFGPVVGVTAGIVLCLVPTMSRYAIEARPYAFACLFSVIALLLLYRFIDRPRRSRLLAYGSAVVGLGLCHIVALTVLGAHLCIAALRSWRTGSWRSFALWAVATAAALAVLSPLVWLGLRQRNEQLYWVPALRIRSLYAFPGALVGSVAAAWLLLGFVAIAIWRPVPQRADMIMAAALPIGTVALVSLVGPHFWVARYLLIVLPPTAILAAAGLELPAEERRHDRPAAVAVRGAALVTACALFAGAALPGQLAVRGRTAKNGSDFRSAAAVIERRQKPGDEIVYTPKSRTLRAGIDYYLRQDPGRPNDVLLERSAASNASLTATEYADAADRIAGATRIWLLVSGWHNDPTTVRRELQPALRSHYQRVQLWHVKWATLALFRRRTPAVRSE
jgi:mannosyltransferase